jgi:hypothetical protein
MEPETLLLQKTARNPGHNMKGREGRAAQYRSGTQGATQRWVPKSLFAWYTLCCILGSHQRMRTACSLQPKDQERGCRAGQKTFRQKLPYCIQIICRKHRPLHSGLSYSLLISRHFPLAQMVPGKAKKVGGHLSRLAVIVRCMHRDARPTTQLINKISTNWV